MNALNMPVNYLAALSEPAGTRYLYSGIHLRIVHEHICILVAVAYFIDLSLNLTAGQLRNGTGVLLSVRSMPTSIFL